MGKSFELYRIAILFFLVPSVVTAQVCNADGSVTLSTQQEVENFQADYGPCDELPYGLRIEGDDIVDLSPLRALARVGTGPDHGFSIYENPNLSSLVGLEGLTSVSGYFGLTRNPLLTDLTGLSALEYIGQGFTVRENANLRDFSGLDSLQEILWRIDIANNNKLQSLAGLAPTVAGASIWISNNDALTTLEGLPTFDQISDLAVLHHDSLDSLEGIEALDGDVTGLVTFQFNQRLQNLQGMEWLESARAVRIVGNAALKNLVGLENLVRSQELAVSENPNIRDLTGLDSFVELYEEGGDEHPDSPFYAYLHVWLNESLTSLSGLESLVAAYNVSVAHNPLLTDCSALRGLLDVIDHGQPGPGPGPNARQRLRHVPDVRTDAGFINNGEGCESIDDVVRIPVVERVMTGSWYDPASAGEGFMIHAVKEHHVNPFIVKIGLAIGYYYGYDNQGERFWLIGVHEGDMQWGQHIEFTATRVIGGTFEDFDPDVASEESWGTFSFKPSHCDAGEITLSGQFSDQASVQEKSLEVVRLGKVAGDYCSEEESEGFSDTLTASWFDPAAPGQGYAFHKINDESGIVYFYGFDSVGQPLWLLGVWSEPLMLEQTVEIPMIAVIGGTFAEVDPENIVEASWGSLRLTMTDCFSGTAVLEGLDGTQSHSLEQLAPSFGLECP